MGAAAGRPLSFTHGWVAPRCARFSGERVDRQATPFPRTLIIQCNEFRVRRLSLLTISHGGGVS